jgi:hypothetical protein
MVALARHEMHNMLDELTAKGVRSRRRTLAEVNAAATRTHEASGPLLRCHAGRRRGHPEVE